MKLTHILTIGLALTLVQAASAQTDPGAAAVEQASAAADKSADSGATVAPKQDQADAATCDRPCRQRCRQAACRGNRGPGRGCCGWSDGQGNRGRGWSDRQGNRGRGWSDCQGNRGRGWSDGQGNRGRGRGAGPAARGQGRGRGPGAGWNGPRDGRGGWRGPRGQSGWQQGEATRGQGNRGGGCLAVPEVSGELKPLPESTRQALRETLLDEYANEMFYQAILDKFGSVRVFERLSEAEARHAGALLTLCHRYGVEPPTRGEVVVPDVPDTLRGAVEKAIAAEDANGKLFEKALPAVEHDDVRTVFERLQYVSLNHHRPALERQLR